MRQKIWKEKKLNVMKKHHDNLRTKKESEDHKNNKKEKGNLLLKQDTGRIFLEDCTVSHIGQIENKKFSHELGEDDQISIVSDVMFKTMLCNSENKMYVCKLLSGLLDMPFEKIMENSDYYKNEFDKDIVTSKGERGDLVLKVNGDYISVEMNNNDETYRNVEFGDRLYRSKILVGEDYVYPQVLSINLDNFFYKEYDEDIVHTFHIQTDEKLSLVKKTYVNIYLPLMIKKWYDEGTEKMSEFERTILTMISTNHKNALEIARGDEILEKYVDDIKKVEKSDDILKEAYDHELSSLKGMRLAGYESGHEVGYEAGHEEGYEVGHEKGYEAGHEEGIAEGREEGRKEGLEKGRKEGVEEGSKEERKNIIKTMLNKNITIEQISKMIDIKVEEIKELLEK